MSESMREFIMVSDDFLKFYVNAEPINESVEPEVIADKTPLIINDLHDLSFKLKAFMETSNGEYALGFESGMQRAAEMVDNLIRRHTDGNTEGNFLRG